MQENLSVLLIVLASIISTTEISCFQFPTTNNNSSLTHNSLTQCLVAIGKKFLKKETAIFYSELNRVNQEAVDHNLILTLTRHWSIVIKNGARSTNLTQNETTTCKKAKIYLLQIQEPPALPKIIAHLEQEPDWNPSANFLVVSGVYFENASTITRTMLRTLFRSNVVNALILLPETENSTTFRGYSWQPYQHDNCRRNFTNITTIADFCSYGKIKNGVIWLKNKLPKTFDKCVVKVSAFNYPPFVINMQDNATGTALRDMPNKGIEVNLLNLVAEKLNLTMFFKSSPNRSLSQLTGTTNANDISIGCYISTYKRFLHADLLIYHYDKLHWCVPHSPVDVQLESMSKIVPFSVELVTFTVWACTSLAMWLTFSAKEDASFKSLLNCCQKSYLALLGLSINRQPRTELVRISLTVMILYSFFSVTAYQTFWTSALSEVSEVEHIRSFQDILNSNLQIIVQSQHKKYFADLNDEKHEELQQRWQVCTESNEDCFRKILQRNASMPFTKLNIDYYKKMYVSRDGAPLVFRIKRPILTFPISILMRKGFPLTKRIRKLVLQIVSAGFVVKWEEDSFERVLQHQMNIEQGCNEGAVAFELNDLKYIFAMWAIGCGISSVSFTLECIIGKYRSVFTQIQV